MKRALIACVLCLLLGFSAGCAATKPHRSEHPALEPIRDGVERFLMLAMTGAYDDLSSLVVPSERTGFNGRAFVENRLRMPINRFEILAWERTLIKVTDLKEGPGVLSSAAVTVRTLADGEMKAIYVNLHWRKSGASWLIEPYPRQ